MSVELTHKERKELEAHGKILEKVKDYYYIKCETDDPTHICNKCMKKHTTISYIVHESDYISPQAQEIKDVLVRLSDGQIYINVEKYELNAKSIRYLESQGYTITNYRKTPTRLNYRIYNIGKSEEDVLKI